MGCRSISMLFLIVVLCLSFAGCFPLSEKDRNWQNFANRKTLDVLDMRNFGRQILDGEAILKQLENVKNEFSKNVIEKEKNERTYDENKNMKNLSNNILTSSNDSHPLIRHKRHYSMSFNAVHSKLTPYLDPNFDPFYNNHVMPCDYQLRNYCLNNGVCAVVRALDIITCRCPVQYTGKRCEMIDSGYLLSLFGF